MSENLAKRKPVSEHWFGDLFRLHICASVSVSRAYMFRPRSSVCLCTFGHAGPGEDHLEVTWGRSGNSQEELSVMQEDLRPALYCRKMACLLCGNGREAEDHFTRHWSENRFVIGLKAPRAQLQRDCLPSSSRREVSQWPNPASWYKKPSCVRK